MNPPSEAQRQVATQPFKPLRLVLMGTGPFAVPSFEALREAGHHIACVVTRPQSVAKSRSGPPPSPVRSWAMSHGFSMEVPESINSAESIVKIRQLNPDLLVVCDYGQILKPEALATARLGGINLHGSLLPKYRGAAPVQWAMLCGEEVTGVSVIHMSPRLDGGPVVTTRVTPISDRETAGELEARLATLGIDATLEAVQRIGHWDGQSVLGAAQDPGRVTKAPRLRKTDGEIDWARSAREIDCHIRGMQPWPIAYTHLPIAGDKPPLRVAVRAVEIVDGSATGLTPGQILSEQEITQANATGHPIEPQSLVVATADRIVRVTRVQPAGKREMSGGEFRRGHKPVAGARFVSL